ncbi:MAG: carbohydrate ABC transporter permease [Eubacteriales bacterium]
MMQSNTMRKFFTMFLQVALGLLFLSPIIWMVSASFKPNSDIFKDLDSLSTFFPTNFTLDNYRDMFQRSNMLKVIGLSMGYISLVILFGTIVNSLAGYAIARLEFPFKKLILGVIIAFYIVPFETVVLPLYLVSNSLDLTNTFHALWVPFVADCFNIFLFKQFFASFPRELSEAAKVDGCSELGIFTKIVVPNSIPVIATSVVLTIVARWSDFMWPLIATTDKDLRTVQLGIQAFFTSPPIMYGPIMAALVFTTLPIIVVFSFLQKYYVQGIVSTGIKG